MALTQQQIARIKQQGKVKGYSEEQINSALIQVTKQSAEGGIPDAPIQQTSGNVSVNKQVSSPTAPATPIGGANASVEVQSTPEEGTLVGNFFKSLYTTGKNFTDFVGEAAIQGGRAIIDPIGDSSEIDNQVKALGEKSRELISLAKKTTNKQEKRKVLQESRDVNDQIEQLGSRARTIGEKQKSFLVDEEKI